VTAELWFLFATAMLLTVLWIPYIVQLVRAGSQLSDELYREVPYPDGLGKDGQMPDNVRRANRAHMNLVEQFPAFAGLVVVAHLAGISTIATAWAAGIYFVSRVVHAWVMLNGTGKFQIRTKIFTVSMLCIFVIGFEIVRKSLF